MAGSSETIFTIGVVGGGFSAASVAAELLRSGRLLRVVLIEPNGPPGRGVAYGTQCAGHLLNVRAQNMSALADDPTHFLRWARVHHDADVQPDGFVPRRVYAQYVESILREARESNPGTFQWKRDEAVSVTPSGDKVEIALRSGSRIAADRVVLALGNFPPGDPSFPGWTGPSPRFLSNPWLPGALDATVEDRSVLLVGSGLTSVDVIISLRELGLRGRIHILSRHGLLPQPHKPAEPWPTFWSAESPRTIHGLVRLVRGEVRKAQEAGGEWQAVVDSLRPFVQDIWQGLPIEERRRFLRHVRPYWDVYRHRAAPQIRALVAAEIAEGRTIVHAGRITEFREDADGVAITYHDRRTGESKHLGVDRVINCTGPQADLRRVSNPLLSDLIGQGLARFDPLFLGLETAPDGALAAADGSFSHLLYAMGPLRKGDLWETIAVPQIRVQAAALALTLLSGFDRAAFQKRGAGTSVG